MIIGKVGKTKLQDYTSCHLKQVHGYATSSLSSYLHVHENLSETSECILGVKQSGIHTLHKAYMYGCGQNSSQFCGSLALQVP